MDAFLRQPARLQRRGSSAPCSRGKLVVLAAQRVRSKRNICINKTLTARADTVEQVTQLCKELVAFSEQEAADKSKGIVVFQGVKDAWDPNTIHFWERYESNVALGRHSTHPHMMELYNKIEPLLDGPMGMAMYEYVDGKLGAASLQGGPKGEGGLDDATGASGAAGGASYKQTSRAFDLTQVNEHDELERDRRVTAGMESGGKAAASSQAEGAAAAAADVTGQASSAGSGAGPGATRMPGGLAGVFRSMQGHAQNLANCMGHHWANITGSSKK